LNLGFHNFSDQYNYCMSIINTIHIHLYVFVLRAKKMALIRKHYRKVLEESKNQHNPSASWLRRRHTGAVGGAPPPLLLTPWIKSSPQADGKSPSTGRKGPTPEITVVVAPNRATILRQIFSCRRCRPRPPARGSRPPHLRRGTRTTKATDPRRSSKERRRRRGEPSPANTNRRATASQTPTARILNTPTLYTRRETRIPRRFWFWIK
jgi:hypothetical protein